MQQRAAEKSIALDLLRVLACLMVTLCHIGIYTGKRFDIGAKGVQVFFVLSGYLAIISIASKDTKGYYIRRIKTIVPQYYIALILIWIFEGLILQGVIGGNFRGLIGTNANISMQYLRYFLFVQCIIPSKNWLYWNNLYGLWTMSAFALFYICTPLIYKICNKWKFAGPVILIATILFRNVIQYDIYKIIFFNQFDHMEWFASQNAFANIYCFMFGATLAFFKIKNMNKAEFLYIMLLSIILFCFDGLTFKYEILATIIVYICAHFEFNDLPQSLFVEKTKKMISYLAAGSYWCYLTHFLWLKIVDAIVKHYQMESKSYLYVIFCIVMWYFTYMLICKIRNRRKKKGAMICQTMR